MNRRGLLAFIAGAAVTRSNSIKAQQATAPVRIGYLGMDIAAGDPSNRRAFLRTLNDLGYVEGRNLTIEYRDAEQKPERFPALAAELIASNVDVIVTAGGTLGALAAKRSTTTVPIVFTVVGDPVTDGIVGSLARPGGNVTGFSNIAPQLIGKTIELLKEIVPAIRRVAFFLKPDATPEVSLAGVRSEAAAAARALGADLQIVEVQAPSDFERAFLSMSEARVDALAVLATPVFYGERQRLAALAIKHRLPTAFGDKDFVVAGGLVSYGPNLAELHRRTAVYVDKILKGAKPADLPVEQPTKFELVINLKTANALGLTMPPSLLARADEVIE